MPYLIDGHNLIGQLADISLKDPNDEAKLVQKLIGFAARTKKRMVVVFDSGLPGGKSRLSTRQVEVIFAPARVTADKVMMGRIKQATDPGQWIVVSNDREVLAAARTRRMNTLTSAQFAPLLKPLQTPTKQDADPGEAADVYLSPAEVEAWLQLFKQRKPKK